MSLGTKTSLVIFTLVVISILMNSAVFSLFITDSFGELEKQEAVNDLERCRAAIQSEGEHLRNFVHDWAAWDDTYYFVSEPNQEYIESNLIWETFRDNSINLILLYNLRGEKIWGKIYDIEKQVEVDLTEFSGKYMPTQYVFFRNKIDSGGMYGIMNTEYGVLLLSSSGIVKSDNTGPVVGHILMGRFLDEKMMRKISNQVNVSCELLPVTSPIENAVERKDQYKILELNPVKIDETHPDTLYLYLKLNDISEQPVSLLKASVHKDISINGRKTGKYIIASVAIVGLAIMLAIIVLLRVLVGNPTRELTRQIAKIGENQDFSILEQKYRNDEIGKLAQEFALMMKKLSSAQEKLLEQSYQAGMAETIINSLHTIRNILFPINASVANVDLNLKKINLANVEKALDEVQNPITPADRKKKLMEYLFENAKIFASFIDIWEEEKDLIDRNLQRIDEILISQEHISKLERISQNLNLANLLIEIFELQIFDKEDFDIELTDGFKKIPEISGEKIKIIQIFKSVFYHLLYTMQNSSGESHVVVDGYVTSNNNKDFIIINIIDSLSTYEIEDIVQLHSMDDIMAMDKEKLPNLHWVSNTLNAMGGSMTFDKLEHGKGLLVTLKLPLVSLGVDN